MSRNRIIIVTIGIMSGLFMASMEVTVVATAMPTIVSELGGLAIYSWVFTAYMLASTTTVPIYGKLADVYGRRPIYLAAMGLFLSGSLLSGWAQSMPQLIAFRTLQGLGAGGLIPLALTMVGDMFSAAQRAKMQGLFSGVWGVSSVIGPLLGGFLVDRISWPWVFYINLGPGAVAALLVWWAWQDEPREGGASRVAIDYAGAALLSLSVVLLLMGLFEFGTLLGWGLLTLAAFAFVALAWVEWRASDPILPLPLFKDRLFSIACLQGLLAGWALFGSIAFVPLFVQSVLGTSATEAGATITPLILGWVTASIIGGRLVLRFSYRALVIFGAVMLAGGTFLLSQVGADATRLAIISYLTMMGVGMGLSIPIFLIIVQTSVPRRVLGSATSTLQFSRTIGGAFGVNVMGGVLSAGVAAGLLAAGLDPASVSVDSLLNPLPGSSVSLDQLAALRDVLTTAMRGTFLTAFVAALLALAATWFTPKGHIFQLSSRQPPAAEAEP
ncbi:MAG: MFS transporter, partial [Anaerolineae bacterium]|nr:MFS transporter [Anaerolineae bacterium]